MQRTNLTNNISSFGDQPIEPNQTDGNGHNGEKFLFSFPINQEQHRMHADSLRSLFAEAKRTVVNYTGHSHGDLISNNFANAMQVNGPVQSSIPKESAPSESDMDVDVEILAASYPVFLTFNIKERDDGKFFGTVIRDKKDDQDFQYTGEVNSMNLPEGNGVIVYRKIFRRENAKYEGDFKNGKRDGQGKLTADGLILEGTWENGQIINGLIQCGSTSYTGEIRNCKANGRGSLVDIPYTREYKGVFEDGLLREGTMVLGNKHYSGIWNKGTLKSGTIVEYENDEPKWTYVGDIYLTKRHGKGVLTTSTDKYDGNFVQDLKHGSGKLFVGNKIFEGKWNNDILSSENVVVNVMRDNELLYTCKGRLKDYKYEGLSEINYSNGLKLLANFKNGQLHGMGIWSSGRIRCHVIYNENQFKQIHRYTDNSGNTIHPPAEYVPELFINPQIE